MQKILFILFGFASLSLSLRAQPAVSPGSVAEACDDEVLNKEMLDLARDFTHQGFGIQLFEQLRVPEKTFISVPVSMEQGEMYQINFVADRYFQKYTLILLDRDKNELIKEKAKGKASQEHYYSRSIAAPYTGDYWILIQHTVKDQSTSCAGLSVLKAGENLK